MHHGASAAAAARLFGDAELVQELSVLVLFPNSQFCSKSLILHLFANNF